MEGQKEGRALGEKKGREEKGREEQKAQTFTSLKRQADFLLLIVNFRGSRLTL